VVLDRQVLTNRSEFRLRGVLLPPPVLLNQRGILLELERTGKRKVHMEDLRLHFGLTRRETEVAMLLARGLSDQAIATRLGISLLGQLSIIRSTCCGSSGSIADPLLPRCSRGDSAVRTLVKQMSARTFETNWTPLPL
jgi:hypothetical protein